MYFLFGKIVVEYSDYSVYLTLRNDQVYLSNNIQRPDISSNATPLRFLDKKKHFGSTVYTKKSFNKIHN